MTPAVEDRRHARADSTWRNVTFHDIDEFPQRVASLVGITLAELPAQVRYLFGYLKLELKAKTFTLESIYIDRHFMDEHALYYSKCLLGVDNYCARLHFFTDYLRDDFFAEAHALAMESMQALAGIERLITERYLGFVVIRPLPFAPIGRSVLRPPSDTSDKKRRVETISTHDVHLLGFKLKVRGLAFAQQDSAVAACATTALWTALQCVARLDGGRAPTPPDIEAAARRFVRTRTSAQEFLDAPQMWTALSSLGYPPDVFDVGEDAALFLFIVATYLRSGIPVVLCLAGENDSIGHAVAAVGLRESTQPFMKVASRSSDVERTVLATSVNLAFDQLYVHDDSVGPYARGLLEVSRDQRKVSLRIPRIAEVGANPPHPEVLPIFEAAAPLYPKLRTNAKELFAAATRLLDIMKKLFVEEGDEFRVETFFTQSGKYARSLLSELPIDSVRVNRFLSSTILSRYVGVVRVWRGDKVFMDAVWDTTDSIRLSERPRQLLGLIGIARESRSRVDQLAKHYRVGAG